MELNELRKIAEAATPGPWKEDVDQRGDCVVWGPNGRFLLNAQAEPHWLEYPGETRSVAFDVDRRDCTHIATFDPPTVLSLLSRLEQAEQAVQRVREVIRQYDPDHLTCMCNSDGDCCKCTVADFQEALDGES